MKFVKIEGTAKTFDVLRAHADGWIWAARVTLLADIHGRTRLHRGWLTPIESDAIEKASDEILGGKEEI